MPKHQEPICHFCGEDYSDTHMPLIAGEDLTAIVGKEFSPVICAKCVQQLGLDLGKKTKTSKKELADANFEIPKPREIYDYLNRFVIGQEKTKRQLSIAVVNHYKRIYQDKLKIALPDELKNVKIEKSNILLVGPTGTGKTLMARMLANIMNVPFAIGDATSITEAGYVGEDVENLILKLLSDADFEVEYAQRGIIYIDEIDKLRKTGGNVSITRDVSGEGVQQSLLKMIEGTISSVPPTGGRKHPEQAYIPVDTTDILFICGGSFIGLEDIIARRIGKGRIGFAEEQSTRSEANKNELLSLVIEDDLEQFGLIPELVGRLPVISSLAELSQEDLVKILAEPENAILKQYAKIVAMEGKELIFTDDAKQSIATLAKAKGTGARGLRSVVENSLSDLMFDLPDANKVIIVDAKWIAEKTKKTT